MTVKSRPIVIAALVSLLIVAFLPLLQGLAAESLATTQTAQPSGADASSSLAVQRLSIGYIFNRGGVVMYVLAAMSILGLALIIYHFMILNPGQIVPPDFLSGIISSINARDWKEVRDACAATPCPLASVVLAGLSQAETAQDAGAAPAIKEMIEAEGSRQAVEIQVRPQYLLDLAILSPMVGLLGSVFGMFTAFNAVALDAAKAKPILLASGVSEALFATAGGLIIGIPAMAFYGFFRSRATRLVSGLEVASTEVLTAFTRGRRL